VPSKGINRLLGFGICAMTALPSWAVLPNPQYTRTPNIHPPASQSDDGIIRLPVPHADDDAPKPGASKAAKFQRFPRSEGEVRPDAVWQATRLPPTSEPVVQQSVDPSTPGPVAQLPEVHAAQSATPEALPRSEHGTSGWWEEGVGKSLRPADRPWSLDLDTLLMIALQHSEHVLAISLEPQIRETEIARQIAQFDSAAFLESKWNDLNDPVGNTLTTGGPSRYLDHDWQNRGGVRRKNWMGGAVEFAQEMGLRNTNSLFFLPANQANTRLVLGYSQPLMRGRGQLYNESVVVLAQIDTDVARRDLERLLQDHFYDIAERYWRLWLERARLMQQRDAAAMTANLLRELENRREVDVLQSHILRAQGALAVRQAAMQRADLAVRNQETRLWALTGAPELHAKSGSELIPEALPSMELITPNREGSIQEALVQRPEVTATLQRIRAAQTRTDVAVHELMPNLNLALQAYSHGLDGGFNVGQAWVNQFASGAPGYTAGVFFEAPLGNAAAQARLRRRQLEARQLTLEFEATLKSVSADVDNVLRDIEAARATAIGQHRAMVAARAELDYILSRWRTLPGEDRATSLMLDEALDALDRLVNAEGSLAQAQVDYALTLIQYKRATGQLFQIQTARPESNDEILVSRAPANKPLARSDTRSIPSHVK
jgi:outer membrane protein TolC